MRHLDLRGLRGCAAPLLAALGLTLARPAGAQNFVRVTDPANPIVNDLFQSAGATWVDLVGDGYLDLFVANGNLGSQTNCLYRNTRTGGGGNFVRVRTGPLATLTGTNIGGSFADWDGDGHADLFVVDRASHGNFFYRSLGDTSFYRIQTGQPPNDVANSNSASWVDLDNDGNLDLYVVNFGGNDFLYLNGGPPARALVRVDTTALTPGGESSISGSWADFNNDGLEDFFVVNAGVQNDYLYTNHGHLFFTRTVMSDGRSGLGCSWGDYDNDGYPDLIVPGYPGAKNILYHNSGPPTYALVAVDTSVVATEMASWAGSAWGDYDNDGNLDLYISNDGGNGALYHNNGPPSYGFTKVTTGSIATDVTSAFGCTWGDYDRDGQLDLYVTNHAGQPGALYHNLGNSNHWMTVRCVGTYSNHSAVGAKIRLFATIAGSSRQQLREVTSQTGYNSGNLDQHFGLGDAPFADSIRAEWPSGIKQTWVHVPADTFLVLREGAPAGVTPPARIAGLGLSPASPSPCRGSATIRYRLPSAARAALEVFDVDGRRVAAPVDAYQQAGGHTARFELPARAPGGVYFVRLTSGGESRSVRMVVVR